MSKDFKDGVIRGDAVQMIVKQLTSSGAGVRMRPQMIDTVLRLEASAPPGMSLTRKVPGGSPTAAVKREFGIRKGLSKQRTYEVFNELLADAIAMISGGD